MPGRHHSRDLKLSACRQIASGEKRLAQVCREHDLAESLLLRWRKEYRERGEAAFGPHQQGEREALAQKDAELERFCGQLALENQVLKSAMSRWDNHDNENRVRDTCRTVVPKVERLPVPRARLKS